MYSGVEVNKVLGIGNTQVKYKYFRLYLSTYLSKCTSLLYTSGGYRIITPRLLLSLTSFKPSPLHCQTFYNIIT